MCFVYAVFAERIELGNKEKRASLIAPDCDCVEIIIRVIYLPSSLCANEILASVFELSAKVGHSKDHNRQISRIFTRTNHTPFVYFILRFLFLLSSFCKWQNDHC